KMRALPVVEKTLVFSADAVEPLCNLTARLLDSDMQPAALELLSPQPGMPLAAKQYALVLRCWNEEAETVEWQLDEGRRLGAELQHMVLSAPEAAEFWRVYHESETASQWTFSLRAATLPSDLGATLADVQRLMPTGIVRAH